MSLYSFIVALLVMASLICSAYAASSQIEIREQNGYRYIVANGLPDHETGNFPNRNNPNRISAQNYRYRLPATPKMAPQVTMMRRQPFGIALNGVLFDSGTAECWGQTRGARPSGPCDWHEEAIVNGKGNLGLDHSNAHVQPNGAYHYHGIPEAMMSQNLQTKDGLVLVGYAADGFKMMVGPAARYRSSYQLKSGQRPSGPKGKYDGTYTEDFSYVANSGELDECNGAMVGQEYAYFVTAAFPFVPRCWKGTPDESFAARGSGGAGGENRPLRPHSHPHPQGHPPHRHR